MLQVNRCCPTQLGTERQHRWRASTDISDNGRKTALPETCLRAGALHAAWTIRCTVMKLTPVSAAIARRLRPLSRSARTRSGRTAALGRPRTFPCALARLRPACTRSESRMRSCLAMAAKIASTASRNAVYPKVKRSPAWEPYFGRSPARPKKKGAPKTRPSVERRVGGPALSCKNITVGVELRAGLPSCHRVAMQSHAGGMPGDFNRWRHRQTCYIIDMAIESPDFAFVVFLKTLDRK